MTASDPSTAAPGASSDWRFPRSARLLDGAAFKRVFAQGRRWSTPALQVHVLPHEGTPRLGLAVSRRVDRRAVQRNRIKRAAREVFRTLRAGLPGADYVVTARREAVALDDAALREELARLLRRAASLKPRVPDGTMPAAAPARARRSP